MSPFGPDSPRVELKVWRSTYPLHNHDTHMFTTTKYIDILYFVISMAATVIVSGQYYNLEEILIL